MAKLGLQFIDIGQNLVVSMFLHRCFSVSPDQWPPLCSHHHSVGKSNVPNWKYGDLTTKFPYIFRGTSDRSYVSNRKRRFPDVG